MANLRRYGSSLFPGLLLLFVGMLLLLHNYRGLDIFTVLGHWWPLILIFWGAVKLYERVAAGRSGDPGAAKVTAGVVFLVMGVLSFLGIAVAVDYGSGENSGDVWAGCNKVGLHMEGGRKISAHSERATMCDYNL